MDNLIPHPDWCITEEGFDVQKNRHYESIFSLGTGFIITRASIEEGFLDDDQSIEYDRRMDNTTLEKSRASKSRWGTFMPVIQAEHPNLRTGIVNLPYYLGLKIAVDGERLDLERSRIQTYRRWLDLRTGTLHRTITWLTEGEKEVRITWRRYMDPEARFACVQEVAIVSTSSANVCVESLLDNNVRTNGYDKFTYANVAAAGDLLYSDVITNRENRIVTASQCFYNFPAEQTITPAGRRIYANASFDLPAGETLHALKISFTAADAYYPRDQLLNVAREYIQTSSRTQPEVLYQRHCAVWEQLWRQSDILIQTRDEPGYNSQLAIRAAIFHLLKAKGLDDRALLCPKGCTTEMYYGSAFWDFEIFMLPFYIYTQPDLARTAPVFRYNHLERARTLARAYGYGGAKYPWQSDCEGGETCVPWQYADHQVHISADVVLGLWHYVLATGDQSLLCEMGAEIFIETSRYWLERVDRLPGRPGLHILGVMGPDEYKPITNNNAYTNFVARMNLELAVQVARNMREKMPEAYDRLAEKVGLQEDELVQFEQAASQISLPHDNERNIIWQCDDFDSAYAEIDIAGMWKDRTRLFGSYVSQEKRYRSKVIKQADVLALLGVFPSRFTPEQKAASFHYYEPFTIHDSSNSMTHRQMVSADLGWKQMAYESWLRAIDIDFGRMPRAHDGLHYANVGGMWQQVVFGFCGMASALNAEDLSFKPCLPEAFHAIQFQAQWKGQRFRTRVMHGEVEVENCSGADLTVRVESDCYIIPPGGTSRITYHGQH
jgi:trehalose/maltose hydrolase-like predicted phosphorylase